MEYKRKGEDPLSVSHIIVRPQVSLSTVPHRPCGHLGERLRVIGEVGVGVFVGGGGGSL